MLRIFLKIVQFIIGFILGILIFSGVSLAGAYLVYTKLANVPPKPVYPDDKNAPPAVVIKKDTPPPVAPSPQPTPSPEKPPVAQVAPPPVAQPAASTTPQASNFNATVLRGLNIRSEPSIQSRRVGGLYYNDKILVLQDSNDQKWQKIRVTNTGVEGWIKSGNIKKIE